MTDRDDRDQLAQKTAPTELVSSAAEDAHLPPVVARMVIEIRSDGSHTIARGAVEDVQQGTRVDLKVEAESPIKLLWKLVRTVGQTPALMRGARQTVRGLLGGKKKQP